MDPAGMDVELQMKALSLYHSTQQGDWKEALTIFKNNPGIHETAINSSGDTVLHVAVNDDKEDMVVEIVGEIKNQSSWSALKTQNDGGDTPLHCAASRGSLKMCMAITEAQGVDTKLSEARNNKGETPLYLAALHGHKDAFLYLHSRCPDQDSRPWKRTSDGETVLHCTIRREHLELAFQIILLYKGDIVGSVDEKGITPLHILANKPSAFESSSNFRWYNKLVYNCIIVKPLMGSSEQQSNNNGTLFNWRIKCSQNTQTGADAENPGYEGYNNVVPPNYWTFYDILVHLFICVIQPVAKTLGFLQDIEDLRKKKQKHVSCRQILHEIWKYKDVAYVGGGSAFRGYSLLRTVKDLPKPGDRQIGGSENKTVKSNDDGNQNQQQDKKNEEIKKIEADRKKLEELGELVTSLFKGKTSESASKALTGCCICLELGELITSLFKGKTSESASKALTGCCICLELGELVTSLFKGKTSESASKALTGCCICLELGELVTSLFKGKTSVSASKALTGCCICLGNGEKKEESDKKESAFFIAAKNGVLEILEKIMKDKPGVIHEINSQGQNVLHVAVKCRQPHVFKLLLEKLLDKQRMRDNLVQNVDNEGNTILHLAARLSEYKPWHIPGSALQMQWEIKWFMYIKDITPPYVLFLPNNDGKTPVDLFREDHENLVNKSTEWLNHTSESCSVVAALIAGVAFATSTTIPGGTQEETGKPHLQRYPAFNMFALTSLLALCCSITSLTMFLAILTSRQQPRDFRKDLPRKLLLGLSSLFVSIASILVSFSAAFFFVLKDSLKEVVFPLYAATILPLTFYAVSQFPLYADLLRAILFKVPQASNRESEKLII